MVISRNSQLGLMMDDKELQAEFLRLLIEDVNSRITVLDKILDISKGKACIEVDEDSEFAEDLEVLTDNRQIDQRITLKIGDGGGYGNLVDNKGTKLYLICDGVEACSKMIKVGDTFSSKALRNIKFGNHTYLLGKDEMCRFICCAGAIKGVYWCRSKRIAFEFGFDLENDGYYYYQKFSKEFNRIAKIITFVELGDIEVEILERGRNNGKPKNDGKVTNTSEYTVYVVDSSWNKLIIRTDGFAVMGHFRLQPCGKDFIDRKLIWINAFEKHGYKRTPRAKIIHG